MTAPLHPTSQPTLTRRVAICLACLLASTASPSPTRADDWPRFRGPDGNATATTANIPLEWSIEQNVRWKVTIPGEGSSSPVVVGDRIYLTSSQDDGTRRIVHCFNLDDGSPRWSREIDDENPEIASILTGHAAPTPAVADGRVVAVFGNAGVVCLSTDGEIQWRQRFGEFTSELGLASSPIIDNGRVYLLCDHDGAWYRTFDSFLIALDLQTGEPLWRSERRGLFRSWSTPILVPDGRGGQELIVNAQDELRGYNPATGELLWQVRGMTGWVTPAPVFADGLIYACSGKDGPTMAVRPGGRGDVTESHVAWLVEGGSPYVSSPVVTAGLVFTADELGVLRRIDATTGEVLDRRRLEGKFVSSPIAVGDRIYLTNDAGTTFVIAATREHQLLAENSLAAEILASPAVAGNRLLIRTQHELFCLQETP